MMAAGTPGLTGQKASLRVRVTDPKGMDLDNCRAFAKLARPLPVNVSIRVGRISVNADIAEWVLTLSIPGHGEFFIESEDGAAGRKACELLSHLPFLEVVK